ncbi:MAG: glycoside hydrolase family 52 protein [Verrucomicrobiota bacterium]
MAACSSRCPGIPDCGCCLSSRTLLRRALFFPDTNIQRRLTPGTDDYTVAGTGLAFTHYTPAWLMTSFSTATLTEKQRFFLPATWMVFTITNANTVPEDFYFGLPVPVTQRTFANGAYQGVRFGRSGAGCAKWQLRAVDRHPPWLRSSRASTRVSPSTSVVPSGQTRTLPVVIAHYRSAVVDSRTGASYYYTSLYPSIDKVIDSAFAGFGDAKVRCQQLATAMSHAGLNPYRQFLACLCAPLLHGRTPLV